MATDYWTEDEAREALKAFEASGLTLAAFGRRAGIAATRLRWWRKRLGPSAAVAAMVPVTIKSVPASPAPAVPPPLEVVLGELAIRVPVGFDGATLVRLLDVLATC
jgi:hypothetical protein